MKRLPGSVCGTDGGLGAAARMEMPSAGAREHARALLLTSSAVVMTVPPISSVLAQEVDAQDVSAARSEEVEQVLVTASRAAINGFSAPSPTVFFGSDLIDRQAASTIAMVLNQNPAFKPTRNPGANATNTSSPGQATADLRALGGQRTLVLVNGMRVVPQAPASTLGVPVTTDLNMIPTPMIERVEVVTGGASAQYGSDAVAGVVNIILKNRFDGVEFKTQYGVAEEGDFRSVRFGGLAGTGFADGRGHVVVSVDYDDNDGVGDIYSRDWGRKEYQIVTNTQRATNGLPALVLSSNVHNNLGAGGLITAPANFSLRNYTFNSDGTIRPFDSGSLPNGSVQIGGEGRSIAAGVNMVPAVRRMTSYGRAEYEFSETLTAFVEAGYSESKAVLYGLPARISNASIARDNAFLPTAVRDAMVAANLNTITFSRIGYDSGNLRTEVTNDTPHAAVGLKGSLGGSWNWDAHYSVGRNNYRGNSFNNQISARTRWAMDAVVDPVSGNVVCRATLSGASFQAGAAGCAPINLFGENAFSPAALDYIMGDGQTRVAYTQHAAAANLRGEPFSTWAGPVSAAAGIEYRREKEVVTADPIAAANGFSSSGNAALFSGDFDVKEAYVETILPLARDLRFANSVDLDLAVRQAEYSTVGGQTTWKAGATYEPFTGLRLRTTRSKDIRAPALFELLSPGSSVTNIINVLGRSAIIPQNTSQGNPNLKAEEADTFTIGMVIEPRGALSELQFSIDYYRIDLQGAISNLSALNIANLCTLGIQSYCDMFTFSPTGQPLSLTAPALNVAAFENSGIDFVASYQKDLADWGGAGTMMTSFSGTWIDHAWVDLGIGSRIDRAGENGQANLGAIPRFRANLSQTYTVGPASLTAQFVYVGSGRQDNTYNTAPTLTINDNSVPAVTYVNLFGSWDLGKSLQLFATVNNLMDKDPPPVPYAVLNVPTNGIYYDKVGRAFQIGATLRF